MFLAILIIIVGVIYALSLKRIMNSNDGSLFALVRSIVEKRKLEINDFLEYTKKIDYAKKGDDYYTDRPPGLVFAGLPFHGFGLPVSLVSWISGVLSTLLVYLITQRLINDTLISFITALIFAFCTLNWRYSIVFYIHSLSTFLILSAVYGLLIGLNPILIGGIVGLATMVEYTDVMYFAGIVIWQFFFSDIMSIIFLGIGYFIGITPLLMYNKLCFGSPFTTSYKYSAFFKWSNSPFTTFVTPILSGAFGLLFSINNGGIFVISPVLVFGIIGFYYLPLSIFALFIFLCLPLFLLISKHKTWWGGDARDYRYISSMLPYLTIPIAFSIKNFIFLWPLILFLAIFSMLMVMIKIAMFTISMKDIKKIDPNLSIEKRGLLGLVKFRYSAAFFKLLLRGLFIRQSIFFKNRKLF